MKEEAQAYQSHISPALQIPWRILVVLAVFGAATPIFWALGFLRPILYCGIIACGNWTVFYAAGAVGLGILAIFSAIISRTPHFQTIMNARPEGTSTKGTFLLAALASASMLLSLQFGEQSPIGLFLPSMDMGGTLILGFLAVPTITFTLLLAGVALFMGPRRLDQWCIVLLSIIGRWNLLALTFATMMLFDDLNRSFLTLLAVA